MELPALVSRQSCLDPNPSGLVSCGKRCEETLVFQDMSGKVYRMSLKGELLWKAGGKEGTWTDGGAGLGHGMVSRPLIEAL